MRLLLPLALAVTLCACSGGPAPRQAAIAGVVAITADDRAVLDQRLHVGGLFAFLHPATTYAVHDGRLDIGVGVADEADDDLRFLLSHQGRIALTSEGGRVWLDRSGIADVQANMGEGGQPVLRFVLTPAGQQRLSRFAGQDAVGSTMLVKLDDETLVATRLGGPLTGAGFQVTLPRTVSEVLLIAQLMRSGALSFQPGAVTVAAAPGA